MPLHAAPNRTPALTATSGSRGLIINGVDVYNVRAKFKLTGTIAFDIGASELLLHIDVPKGRKQRHHSPHTHSVQQDRQGGASGR